MGTKVWVPAHSHCSTSVTGAPVQMVFMGVATGKDLTIHASSSQGTQEEENKPLNSWELKRHQQTEMALNLTSGCCQELRALTGRFSNARPSYTNSILRDSGSKRMCFTEVE